MTPQDFAYWLQGYFEIFEASEKVPEWDSKTRSCVRKHLELVDAATVGHSMYDERLLRFLGWMEAALDGSVAVHIIKRKLNDIFEHVVDPSVQGNQQQLNQIHKC